MAICICGRIWGLVSYFLLLSLAITFPVISQTYKGFQVGRYEGKVYNKTGNSYGKAQFDILSIKTNGAVRVHLREYDGLEGEGDLSGAINDHSVMQVSGSLVSPSTGAAWQLSTIAVMQNGNLRFANRLTLKGKLEEESATMAFKGAATPAAPSARPVAANSGSGIQNGIYLHPNYPETEALYFGPNGRVWTHLSEGFTLAGLAAHQPAYRGTYRLNGNKLIVTNDNNYTTTYTYNVSKKGHPILNDIPLELVTTMGNPQALVGEYFHNGGYGSVATASTLILRANGSYVRGGVGSYRSDGQSYGGSSDETGTWQYANHTLTFRAQNGTITQKIALLPPKGSMSSALGALYMGGALYRRKQ